MDDYVLRSASVGDAADVAALVDKAYGHYVERIGMLPGPMTLDYAKVVTERQVTIADLDGTVVGVLVLGVDDEGFVIENVAVHPSLRGKGLGHVLLRRAETEAVHLGFDSIHLDTHEKMTENLALYSRTGYTEYHRRSQGTFSLVYMHKTLQ